VHCFDCTMQVKVSANSQAGGRDKGTKEELKDVVAEKVLTTLIDIKAQIETSLNGDCSVILDQSIQAGGSSATCQALAAGEVVEIGAIAVAEAGVLS
jgi:hypothetical protein